MQSSGKLVSVSIASYNNRAIIADCISSVLSQTHRDTDIVLVDNASTDGTAGFVRERFPSVRVIENPANELFCAAQNKGIGAGSGEYALVLNSDVVLEPEFIERAVSAMDADAKIGSVSGRILRTGGGVIDTTGLFRGRDRRPVDRGYGEPDDGRYMEAGYVFGAGGVAPLYRRAMLDDVAVGGEYFDESYGAFYEDLDLAWRAAARGWKAWYEPAAVAYHMRGATARTEKPAPAFLRDSGFARLPDRLKSRLVVNRYMTMIKNDSLKRAAPDLPYILLYDLKLWAYMLFFAPGAIPGVLRGMGSLRAAWARRGKTNAI